MSSWCLRRLQLHQTKLEKARTRLRAHLFFNGFSFSSTNVFLSGFRWSSLSTTFQTIEESGKSNFRVEIIAIRFTPERKSCVSMAMRVAARYVFHRLSSSGKVLNEEGKAAENVCIKVNTSDHFQRHELEESHKRNDHELEKGKPSIGSPARIQKLIASQSDPLLAKEIYDLAARQPNFKHSYATFYTLILKLGRARHFSLMQTVLSSFKSHDFTISPSLFSHIIRIYGDAKMYDKALKTFYTILEFNMKPHTKHLNCILEILVGDRKHIRAAFDLFRAAHKYGVNPNTRSYNIMIRAFCLSDDLGIAYSLFNQMFKRDVLPDVESYRILMQGLCRKSQVNTAVDLLEDMLNKGFVPDTLSYTTLLNSLCRKKKLKEAYKLLCRMKVKGCNPDIVHYNTVILGYCKAGCAADACKVLEDMSANGCLPNLVSYQNIVGGLCNQGMYEEAKSYILLMMSKGLSPHFSVIHLLTKSFCNIGKTEDACEMLVELLKLGNCPHTDTWAEILPRICDAEDAEAMADVLQRVLEMEIRVETRIVDVGAGLEQYLIRKIKSRSRTR